MHAKNPRTHRARSMLAAGPVLLLAVGGWSVASNADHQETNPFVVLETSLGNITIELLSDKSPITVENFLQLVRAGFYDEMLFHRVVDDFAIQTGLIGMDGQVRPHEVPPLENEAGNRVRNLRGAVAMARGPDPQSADTQFFINVKNNPELDFSAFTKDSWGYAVFGYVKEGMDVVEQIARIDTKRVGPFRDFPAEPVALYAAYVRE